MVDGGVDEWPKHPRPGHPRHSALTQGTVTSRRSPVLERREFRRRRWSIPSEDGQCDQRCAHRFPARSTHSCHGRGVRSRRVGPLALGIVRWPLNPGLLAPSVWIRSTKLGGRYAEVRGTSLVGSSGAGCCPEPGTRHRFVNAKLAGVSPATAIPSASQRST